MAASGSAGSDPAAAAQELAGLEPPAEIAQAWDVMIADRSTSPADMSPEVEAALSEVTNYVMTNCADELSTQLGELEGELGEMPTEVPGG
jgi:hypothetical protein